MKFERELSKYQSVFIDTAPIIYYIEAHPQFGKLSQTLVNEFNSGNLAAFTSVITLVEVLPKPVKENNEQLTTKFTDFLKNGKNISLLEITPDIAERAGKLRGKYHFLKTMDAIQIAVAVEVGADIFVTNDEKLNRINEIGILVLKDFLD